MRPAGAMAAVAPMLLIELIKQAHVLLVTSCHKPEEIGEATVGA